MDPNFSGETGKGCLEADAKPSPGEMVPIRHFSISFLVALQQDFFDWRRGFKSTEIWTSRMETIERALKANDQRSRD